jgi:2-desacetyl-2-hydroxyethyl bacteriochlorophyllide A dehydrogenase
VIHRSIVHHPDASVSLEETRAPEPPPGHAVVRSEMTGISPGTELRMLRTPGNPGGPYVPGYCVVGRLVSTGGRADLVEGLRVVCPGGAPPAGLKRWLGGHQSHHVVPAENVVAVPDKLEAEDAVLSKLAAIALRGLRAGRFEPGQRVLVIGLGIIGQCAARLWADAGADVVGVDRLADRVAAAEQAGLKAVDELNLAGDGYDTVVDCTGAAAVMADAILRLRQDPWTEGNQRGPTYVLQGSYSGDVQFNYEDAFQRQATFVIPRDSTLDDLRLTLSLIAESRLPLRELLTDVHQPASAPQVYAQLAQPGESQNTMGVAFRWTDDSDS